jgi:hypothetical protein
MIYDPILSTTDKFYYYISTTTTNMIFCDWIHTHRSMFLRSGTMRWSVKNLTFFAPKSHGSFVFFSTFLGSPVINLYICIYLLYHKYFLNTHICFQHLSKTTLFRLPLGCLLYVLLINKLKICDIIVETEEKEKSLLNSESLKK